MPDPTKIDKTITGITKENRDEDIIRRDLRFLLDPEKDHYKPVKTDNAFNNNYFQYESIGDINKLLSIEEYIDMMRPHISDIINNDQTQLEWRIYLTILINFISSKYSDETRIMYSRSDNIKIILNNIKIMCIETDEIIEELFESLLQRY